MLENLLGRATGLKAVRILISGRVQGVGFRWFAEQRASELAVAGYVRNLPGGQVEVLAQADEGTLESFCEELRQGPNFARVEELTVKAVPVDSSLQGFGVRF
jgi:acylphosphatase